ncbi:FHA domain-containing protein [Arcanobacterium buesumense]|uniref:FHA domain-containing protein n=1 Tax=Arcanobacterium buesumense TaxID=2722751 RepID=A0A6H2EKP0_9ACTO|nr:FHA domain-containing protein [Arcanobacterium buesumense]QJC21774.1 FHA domain-containing protein [Arcanobacterium buesumense]
MNNEFTTPDQWQDPTATSRFSAISQQPDSPTPGRGLDAEDIATINALPEASALLIALNGPNVGARFLLNSDRVLVGRHTRADIFLDDVTVSRKHAVFERTDQGFVVRDQNSLNGTYVNMNQVDEAALSDGDEVRIGKFQLTFYGSPKVAK